MGLFGTDSKRRNVGKVVLNPNGRQARGIDTLSRADALLSNTRHGTLTTRINDGPSNTELVRVQGGSNIPTDGLVRVQGGSNHTTAEIARHQRRVEYRAKVKAWWRNFLNPPKPQRKMQHLNYRGVDRAPKLTEPL